MLSASGTVYKAEHKESGKHYALKKIKNTDFKTIENTMKEIKFMGSVKHPNALEFSGFYIVKQDCWVCRLLKMHLTLCLSTCFLIYFTGFV
jgi:serine/threonine protein kinase